MQRNNIYGNSEYQFMYPEVPIMPPPQFGGAVIDPRVSGFFLSGYRDHQTSQVPPIPISSFSRNASTQFSQATIGARPTRSESLARNTMLCKHFTRNQGWCPVGDACNFIHDHELYYTHAAEVSRVPPTSSIKPSRESQSGLGKDPQKQGSTEKRAPVSKSHCWAYVQERCRTQECRYFHPQNISPYKKYTPCVAWDACPNVHICPFKHPPQSHPAVEPQDYPPIVNGFVIADGISSYGSYEINGTTYFSPKPIPLSATPYIGYAPLPFSYNLNGGAYDTAYAALHTHPSEHLVTMEQIADAAEENTNKHALTRVDQGFPHQPLVHQRKGHARRISVAVKAGETSPGENANMTDRRPLSPPKSA